MKCVFLVTLSLRHIDTEFFLARACQNQVGDFQLGDPLCAVILENSDLPSGALVGSAGRALAAKIALDSAVPSL